jgi:general secretion pathway protein D
VNDKIPILGDIPVIGRLFQSKYTTSEKTNLMVFMTCRIIKADGSAKHARNARANDNGLPEFPRNQ